MSIRLTCSCGEALVALDVFAGGQIKCGACEQMVPVPIPVQDSDVTDKIHFACPHCSTRVVGRKTSVGKLSRCPACEGVYVVPQPESLLPHSGSESDDHEWEEDEARKWPENQSDGWGSRPAKKFNIDVNDVMFLPGMLDRIEQDPGMSLGDIQDTPIGRKEKPKPPKHSSLYHAGIVPKSASPQAVKPAPQPKPVPQVNGNPPQPNVGMPSQVPPAPQHAQIQHNGAVPPSMPGTQPPAPPAPPLVYGHQPLPYGVVPQPPSTPVSPPVQSFAPPPATPPPLPQVQPQPVADQRESSDTAPPPKPARRPEQPPDSASTKSKENVAVLRFPTGEFAGRTVPLNVRTFLIGRERDCHLQIRNKVLNRHHCVIKSDEFSVRIRDLGTKTGTFINEMPCEAETLLNHRDHIRIGDVSMQLILPKGLIEDNMPLEAVPMMDDFVVY